LRTVAQILVREFALVCEYSAAGIAERIYARSGELPMAAAAGLGSETDHRWIRAASA
jgi:hypothetical protein